MHIAAKHERKRPFQCELCGVRYRVKRCYQRHRLQCVQEWHSFERRSRVPLPKLRAKEMHREHKRSQTANEKLITVRTKLNVQMERNEFLDVWVKKERNVLNKKVSNADNKNQALEKNLKEISQDLTDAKIEIGKLKQEKSELQVQALLKLTRFSNNTVF